MVTRELVKWAWGLTPATDVQATCHAAVQDGCVHPEVLEVSAMGAFGSHVGNVNRELKRRYLKELCMPIPYACKVAAVDPKSQGVIEEECYIILPFDWFSKLAEHYEDYFEKTMGSRKIGWFWDTQDRSRPQIPAMPQIRVWVVSFEAARSTLYENCFESAFACVQNKFASTKPQSNPQSSITNSQHPIL